MTQTACLDEEQILGLIAGTAATALRSDIEEHLDGCEVCRRLVSVAVETGGGRAPRAPLGRGDSVGRYFVLSRLGRGSMGEVFTAYDPELDRKVAVKLLRTAGGAESARRRFVREARALGKLSHPNVVQVHDVGEHDGDVFIAMELVDGPSVEAFCAASPRPGFREVLAAYVDAARGLSAAHASGLVHRDVKPANLLRGSDGRVRVADFGLAGVRADELSLHASGGSTPPPPGEAALTVTGALLGTPLYMAPEQHERAAITPASDQYSLCVALYQGLYGALPFPVAPAPRADLLRDLLAHKRAGPPASPPAGSPVPAWVHRAVAQGLAPDPGARHPSMDALVEALTTDPTAIRRARLRRAATAAAMTAVAAALAAGWIHSAFADPCRHPEQQLAGAWDGDVRARVRAAFVGSGRSYGADSADRVVALLDRYGAEWSAMRAEICRASRAGADRSEILALREHCLDRRRGEVRALTRIFAEGPDPQVLDRAVQVTADLFPVAACADVEALRARVRPPEGPALSAQVAALDPRVAEIEALFLAGKYKQALALGEPLRAEVAAVPYAPLRARVQYWVGRLRDATGDYEGAKALLREASVSAAEGRDEVLAASAWSRLLYVVGEHQQRFDEVPALRALGPMIVAGAHDLRAKGAWLNVEGLALWRMGKYAEAKAALEQSLLALRQAGASDLTLAPGLNNLGLVLSDMDDYAGARAASEEGLSIREKNLGPDHPYVAQSLSTQARVLSALGEFAAARDLQARVLSIREKTLGPDHPDVGLAWNNLANDTYVLGDHAGAATMFDRALAIFEKALGPDHPHVALALYNIGYLQNLRGDPAGALAPGERALSIREARLGPEHPLVADSLIAVGRARVGAGQLDAASAALDRARRLKEKDGSKAGEAELLLGLAELSLARRAPDQAVPLLERALPLPAPDIAGELRLTLAEALRRAGKDDPRARALAAEALAGYERLGHGPGAARARRWLADHPAPR